MSKWQRVMSYVFFALIIGATVTGSPIKNWTSGEYVTYTDLNATLNHLHSNLGHGHGPIITAADISPSAGIKPEQTTFGSSLNRSLVANGTWQLNPDAGTAYIPVNTTGTLALTVFKISTTGFGISGAAETGALADGGVYFYTVSYKPVGLSISDSLYCADQGSTPSLKSPLYLAVDCYDMTDATWPLTMKNPSGISIQVYNNKVQ